MGIRMFRCYVRGYGTRNENTVKTVLHHRKDHVRMKLLQCQVCDSGARDRWTPCGPTRGDNPDVEQESDRDVAEKKTPRPLKGIRIFSCNICGFSISFENRAMRHRLLHFEPRCGTCGEEFALHASLVEHVQSYFSAKLYQCVLCLLRFKNEGHLKGHVRTHTGERPFACGVCDAKFLRKHTLALHAKRHTGERPFACHLCPEAFIRKCSLQVHLKSHERK
ncbi:zinc finger protein, putative [Ixodes scapularis]|uniref:Zinc finger protein, putative n=1 Tax=Ixodes scapularis TaxID=6945 RepID=B7PVM4_IXOSC|nr:zinc finger protein, putative [Ixodes scapularis]|eukprot:XP_002408232.1 zinc finger protein, putative [Ixodes scapularis]